MRHLRRFDVLIGCNLEIEIAGDNEDNKLILEHIKMGKNEHMFKKNICKNLIKLINKFTKYSKIDNELYNKLYY